MREDGAELVGVQWNMKMTNMKVPLIEHPLVKEEGVTYRPTFLSNTE